MVRMAQDKGFVESAAQDMTQQMESRFTYVPNGEGFINNGIYILQYNEDLSVTEVN